MRIISSPKKDVRAFKNGSQDLKKRNFLQLQLKIRALLVGSNKRKHDGSGSGSGKSPKKPFRRICTSLRERRLDSIPVAHLMIIYVSTVRNLATTGRTVQPTLNG